jgi:hypothetical protein
MTDPNDPTQVYRPVGPSGPPTQAMPPVGGDSVPPGGPYGPAPGGPSGPPESGPNPIVVALLAVIVVLAIAVVVLLLVNRKGSSSSVATSTTTGVTTTTSATSTTAPPTTLAVTLPPLPTTTTPPTTSAPSTTASTSAGNRAPTAAEQQQIRSDSPAGANGDIDQIRIANSDPSWALEHVRPAPGHESDFQAAYRILHQSGGTWTQVSSGTAQVQCGNGVPPDVAADFADILGNC